MQILSIIRIVGLLVALFSSTMLLPAMVALGIAMVAVPSL